MIITLWKEDRAIQRNCKKTFFKSLPIKENLEEKNKRKNYTLRIYKNIQVYFMPTCQS